jgi:hypothetical protein
MDPLSFPDAAGSGEDMPVFHLQIKVPRNQEAVVPSDGAEMFFFVPAYPGFRLPVIETWKYGDFILDPPLDALDNAQDLLTGIVFPALTS